MEEDLLERRLSTGQLHDRVTAELRQQRPDLAGHLEPEGVGAGARDVDAGERGELRRRPGKGGLDRLGAEMTQLGERSFLDESALAQDPDAIAECLDLTQDVRRE